ncbi:MAG TPA: tRNA (adenosine(37)-N6)-dimethylallyltransferase MiaA [Candidatus Acidoferrales bacterium]|nr:tRNA (adenosine(37)-N6)-dimethylallyltransferase MiaA [Candidatus Acidoferrales bacterium]
MSTQQAETPMVAIVGPTASGKSALAVFLAESLGGEVIACDSTQLYRRFDIGTAKPEKSERRNIPHHLLDIYEPEHVSTAGEYRRLAMEVLEDLLRRQRLPVLTVGTGLYLRALLEGLAETPLRSEELRKRLAADSRKKGPDYLHRLLRRLDPEAARRIASRDHQKLVRAIEICILAGKRITEVHRSGRAPLEGFRPVKIGLNPPRGELYKRIGWRVAAMLDRGWLEEVRQLVASGLPADSKPFEFIGYRELRSHLEGRTDLSAAVAAIEQATRRYAKRQLTWFRKEAGVAWFEGFGDNASIQGNVLVHVREDLQERSWAGFR